MVRRRTIAKVVPALISRVGTIETESRLKNEEWPKADDVSKPGEPPEVGIFQFCVPWYGHCSIKTTDNGYNYGLSKYTKRGIQWQFYGSRNVLTGKQIQNLFNKELEEWGFNPDFVAICKKTLTTGVYHGRMRTTTFSIDEGWPMLTSQDIDNVIAMFMETARKYEYDPENDPRALRKKVKGGFLGSVGTGMDVNSYYNWASGGPKFSTKFRDRNTVPNGLERFSQIRPALNATMGALQGAIENYNVRRKEITEQLNKEVKMAYDKAILEYTKDQQNIIDKEAEVKLAMDKIITEEGL